MLKRIIAGVVLTLMLTGGAAAGPVEEGVAAYKRGDYATALRLWRPLAEQGDAGARRHLGTMYFKGQGVPQDDVEAVKWWRLAAEQGHADAQYNLGVSYAKGKGGLRSRSRREAWGEANPDKIIRISASADLPILSLGPRRRTRGSGRRGRPGHNLRRSREYCRVTLPTVRT